jgi:hypothetical protein
MSGALEFLNIFVARLREAKIRFMITSGMACVHYGQQGVQRAAALTGASPSELGVKPPIEIILP